MTDFQIFGLQNTLSLIVYALIAKWYVWPRISQWPTRDALVPLLWVHAFRHIAWTLATVSQVDSRIPREWLQHVAYGDLISMILALLSIVALRWQWGLAIGLVWVFNIFGTLDLVTAFIGGLRENVTQYPLGLGWYIVNFLVPALWVTHVMIFVLLLKKVKAN